LAERRLDVPAPRQESVDLVGDAGDAEDDGGRPRAAAVRGRDQPDEDRQQKKTADRERVRKVSPHHDARIRGVRPLAIPGFVDAHCHAFQRALRGRARGGDFWAWRQEMVALAASLTVPQIRREYTNVYRELLANGFTAVGEFHYLGLEEARAAAAAAEEAGVAFVCLFACYLRGGIPPLRPAAVRHYLPQL